MKIWAIATPMDEVLNFTACSTPEAAMAAIAAASPGFPWLRLHRLGYRAVRIRAAAQAHAA